MEATVAERGQIILRKNVDDAVSRARGKFKLDGFDSVDTALDAVRGHAPAEPSGR